VKKIFIIHNIQLSLKGMFRNWLQLWETRAHIEENSKLS